MKTTSLVRSGIGRDWFYYGSSGKPILFNKEPIGSSFEHIYNKTTMVNYAVLPPERYAQKDDLHVILLFRDPVMVWNSWTKRKWAHDLGQLTATYDRLTGLDRELDDQGISTTRICFENFLKSPESYLGQICTSIGIAYDPAMIEWNKDWGHRLGGHHRNVDIDKIGLQKDYDRTLIIPSAETQYIEDHLGQVFQDIKTKY